ncbi:DUF6197 family protein [Pseudonocardia oceani]|uniref:MmgE/PrpD family protein n=1 Tax=Pseudonocardia oceani TaxID=2792013 RepID=A0ABS6UK11_9PSEU|nr:hypothetical protein [Pseudonocardia oceani]MBW0131228.1 hypothetical protein [Pseudonocardia oceani]MBW0132605.1 hypothetical protein [Pseudonocardia oceani]
MTDLALPTHPLTPAQLNPSGIADALDRAAHLIHTNGLATGEYWECQLFATRWTEGRGCDALGAIGVAVGYRDHLDIDRAIVGEDVYDPKAHAYATTGPHPVLAALMAHLGVRDPLDVMNWSDKAQDRAVVEALRACAAGLRIHAAAAEQVGRVAS